MVDENYNDKFGTKNFKDIIILKTLIIYKNNIYEPF